MRCTPSGRNNMVCCSIYFLGARLKASHLGDIIHVQVFGHHMVILSSLRAARDLLESRGAIYSDRPRFVLLSEMSV